MVEVWLKINNIFIFMEQKMETKKFKPIGMQWHTLPTLYANNNGGESYEWGEFLITFQEKPVSQIKFHGMLVGEQIDHYSQLMEYYYSMLVFYKTDKFDPIRARPILVLSLEYVDYSGAESDDPEISEIINLGKKTIFIGMFDAECHSNFGRYEGSLDPESVKKKFFSILGKELNLNSEPVRIGTDPFIYLHENMINANKF